MDNDHVYVTAGCIIMDNDHVYVTAGCIIMDNDPWCVISRTHDCVIKLIV